MSSLRRGMAIAALGAGSLVGGYEFVSHTDYNAGEIANNAAARACAQHLGNQALKTAELPDACTLYENDFVQQITTTEMQYPNGDSHETSRTLYYLPTSAAFLKQEIEKPNSGIDRTWGTLGFIALIDGVFYAVFRSAPKKPTKRSEEQATEPAEATA